MLTGNIYEKKKNKIRCLKNDFLNRGYIFVPEDKITLLIIVIYLVTQKELFRTFANVFLHQYIYTYILHCRQDNFIEYIKNSLPYNGFIWVNVLFINFYSVRRT